MKRLLSIVLVFIFSISLLMTSSAEEYMGAWVTDDIGTWYRYNDGTYPSSCFIKKDRKLYYINQDGYVAPNVSLFGGYQTDSQGTVIGYTTKNNVYSLLHTSDGWRQDANGWWYQYPDGSYPKNTDITVNGKLYWLGIDGYMLHDCYARNHGYYGSDGSYANKLDKNAKITIQQPASDTRSDGAGVENTSNEAFLNLVHPVDIIGGGFVENYVGGISPSVAFRNNSGKDIKYVTLEMTPYNRVGDPVNCTIRNYSTTTCRATGPYAPDMGVGQGAYSITSGLVPIFDHDTDHPYYYTSRTFEKRELEKAAYAKTFNNMPGWENVWYNSNIYKIKITKAIIDYMDGTSDTISSLDITMFHDDSLN
jgi:hypothetical protein